MSVSRDHEPTSGIALELLAALKEAVVLLGRCEHRLDGIEGLNRSRLRFDLQEFQRAGIARAAIAKAEPPPSTATPTDRDSSRDAV